MGPCVCFRAPCACANGAAVLPPASVPISRSAPAAPELPGLLPLTLRDVLVGMIAALALRVLLK